MSRNINSRRASSRLRPRLALVTRNARSRIGFAKDDKSFRETVASNWQRASRCSGAGNPLALDRRRIRGLSGAGRALLVRRSRRVLHQHSNSYREFRFDVGEIQNRGLRKSPCTPNVEAPCGTASVRSAGAPTISVAALAVGGACQSQETIRSRRYRMACMPPESHLRIVHHLSCTALRGLVVQLRAVDQRCVAPRVGQTRHARARAARRPRDRRLLRGYS